MIIVNGREITSSNFPGGEVHVSVEGMFVENTNIVVAYLYSSDDIMQLLLIVDALRQEVPQCEIFLEIPYFPYGRQDRVCSKGEAFSLKVMCDLINSLKCKVTVTDPHSEKTQELLDNCLLETQEDIFLDNDIIDLIREQGLILVAPDAGAEKKVRYLSEKYGLEAIYCTKKRVAGKRWIDSYLQEDFDYEGKNFIVIDDICDEGMTFINLADKLLLAGANDLHLYVTHGIFSQGFSTLRSYYKYFYCYHTFINYGDDSLKDINLTIFKRSLLDKGEI